MKSLLMKIGFSALLLLFGALPTYAAKVNPENTRKDDQNQATVTETVKNDKKEESGQENRVEEEQTKQNEGVQNEQTSKRQEEFSKNNHQEEKSDERSDRDENNPESHRDNDDRIGQRSEEEKKDEHRDEDRNRDERQDNESNHDRDRDRDEHQRDRHEDERREVAGVILVVVRSNNDWVWVRVIRLDHFGRVELVRIIRLPRFVWERDERMLRQIVLVAAANNFHDRDNRHEDRDRDNHRRGDCRSGQEDGRDNHREWQWRDARNSNCHHLGHNDFHEAENGIRVNITRHRNWMMTL